MFFFVDESRQTVSGISVSTLGCIAIPAAHYNRFCRVVYRAKRAELGAFELQDKEIKGNVNLCRAAFKAQSAKGVSPSLETVSRVLAALRESGSSVIAIATVAPVELSIRARDTFMLTEPYVDLVLRMHSLMKRHRDKRGLLFLDQVGHREDQRAACAIQNFFVRTRLSAPLSKCFVQVPHFTHSNVSPGLQVADLIAYLCAHTVDDFSARPELRHWWEEFASLAYVTTKNRRKGTSIDPFDAR